MILLHLRQVWKTNTARDVIKRETRIHHSLLQIDYWELFQIYPYLLHHTLVTRNLLRQIQTLLLLFLLLLILGNHLLLLILGNPRHSLYINLWKEIWPAMDITNYQGMLSRHGVEMKDTPTLLYPRIIQNIFQNILPIKSINLIRLLSRKRLIVFIQGKSAKVR